MSRWIALVSVAALWLAPRVASACPVCFSGADETRDAFVLTSVLMSAVPPVLIGSVVWWLRRRVLQAERDLASQGGALARESTGAPGASGAPARS
jgi:hypothetical protein